MRYVLSDIHGMFKKLKAMLELIRFDPSVDTLYVLGDCVDRGPEPLSIVRYLMELPGVVCLLGNHEWMMLECLDDSRPRDTRIEDAWPRWQQNGCDSTLEQWEELDEGERQSLLVFLRNLPMWLEVDRFVLVHSGIFLMQDRQVDEPTATVMDRQSWRSMLWSREEFYQYPALTDRTVVFGHTPTIHMQTEMPLQVWHDPMHGDKIGIDCGAFREARGLPGGRLACLRLDDLKEFYVA